MSLVLVAVITPMRISACARVHPEPGLAPPLADKPTSEPADIEYRSKFKQIKAVLEKEKFSGVLNIFILLSACCVGRPHRVSTLVCCVVV